ncbi:MAG: matrixin family metalloprotease [Acidobacteriota bacterium]|nr:matrixin family metalloprotease [Acidobacteriota bacterium]
MIAGLLLYLSQALSYPYWVEPCTRPAATGCQSGDAELAAWALEAWQNASGGHLTLIRASDPQKARIRLYWADAQQGMYGEARPILFEGKPGAEVYVRPAPLQSEGDRLLRDAIVFLTCVHETGHALGLPHTANFDDIMYSFQFGGNIVEYFGRYRRKVDRRGDLRSASPLTARDRAHLLSALKN